MERQELRSLFGTGALKLLLGLKGGTRALFNAQKSNKNQVVFSWFWLEKCICLMKTPSKVWVWSMNSADLHLVRIRSKKLAESLVHDQWKPY